MTNGPVADTAVQPASRRAAKGARGCPTRPLGCGYELRRRRAATRRSGAHEGRTTHASQVAPGVETSSVTVAGGRLQAVPVALPFPRDRPAARAALPRSGARIRGGRT